MGGQRNISWENAVLVHGFGNHKVAATRRSVVDAIYARKVSCMFVAQQRINNFEHCDYHNLTRDLNVVLLCAVLIIRIFLSTASAWQGPSSINVDGIYDGS